MNTKRIHQILSRNSVTKFFSTLLITLTILVSSCNESTIVGLDVQPPGDLLNVAWQDTVTILTKTVKEDSLRTDAGIIVTGDALLGNYWDPTFGMVTGSLFTQLRLPTNAPTFGTNPICDSVVIALCYDPSSYGSRSREAQYVNVYQLTQDIVSGTEYYSNNSLGYSPHDITIANSGSGYKFVPRPTDSLTVLGTRVKAQLRIPLENGFGQVILNNQGNPELASNSAFQTFTKGLYITTENVAPLGSDEGNMLHFKMADAQSKMTIYYHNSTTDSLKYELPLSAVSRFSKFGHDYGSTYADSDLRRQLGYTGTVTAQNSTLYVSGMAGTKALLKFPYLEHLNDSGAIAINRAELVLKVDTTQIHYLLDTFAAPAKLILFGIDSEGLNYSIPDMFDNNLQYDGSYNASDKSYHFNIDRYIQQILNGTRANTGMYLIASGGAVNPNRVVLGGGGATGYTRMKLNITYTKLH